MNGAPVEYSQRCAGVLDAVAGVGVTASKSWRTVSRSIWPSVVDAPTSFSQFANAIRRVWVAASPCSV